ncbi:fatty acid desaturase [Roseivirga echinicomitans]|uniref:Portal protein n=1 Tax=Roseivirga echinicomitans TaxID=296218 RepID=A0A150XVG6_9BACT|nr:fatty acid desaturase [Roseivirga echinicomitans]KYG82759.1 portal protein [Roseivirga echinicomitans]
MKKITAEKITLEKDQILSLRKYAEEHKTKATIQIINSFLPFIGIWILMYFSLDISYWLTFALGILNAFFLVRIFIIQHDCGHQSFVKNRTAQKIIGYACSYFSTIPFNYWAKSHSVHHKLNGQLELRDIGDVTTYTVAEFQEFSKGKRFGYRVYRSPIVMFLIGPIYYVFIHNRLAKIKLPAFKSAKKGVILNNILLLAAFTILGFSLGWVKFLLVHVTILVMFSIIAIWFFYVQHQHEHGYKQWKKNWDYVTSALKGSTYYKIPRVFNWLTGNIGIHHVHHLNPLIPNYNLKKCIKENPWLNQFPTIIGFRDSLKLASNKLWCETQQRMISFREFYEMERRGLIPVPVSNKSNG